MYRIHEKEKFLKLTKYYHINYKVYCLIILLQQFLILSILICFIYNKITKINDNKKMIKQNSLKINFENKLDYDKNHFAILKRTCNACGFFSHYKVFLSCIHKFLIRGFIPILEVKTYPNIFNGFKANTSSKNPWEYFFVQPFGYSYENVIKKAKNIKYINCKREQTTPQYINFFKNKIKIDFWHNLAKIYLPIKEDIIKETTNVIYKLFKNYDNILGILIRGTDYLACKPRHHPIPPAPKRVIKDIKKMDNIYRYNYFFIVTEDNIIRNKFINEFDNKIKYLLPNKIINYDYKNKKYISKNKNIKGNLINLKIYLINIIILSKCKDIIVSRTNGALGAYILTEGFRKTKVYFLGLYP